MKGKRLFSKYTIYLLVLLGAVLLYLLLVYPRMMSSMGQTDAQYNTLKMQVDALTPYQPQSASLALQTQSAQAAFEADSTLLQPASLANLVSDSADEAGVILESVAVSTDENTSAVAGYTGQCHIASIVVDVPSTDTPAHFLQALEAHTGAGFYVTDIDFTPAAGVRTPEQGAAAANTPVPAAAAAAAAAASGSDSTGAAAGTYSQMAVTVSFYTVEK